MARLNKKATRRKESQKGLEDCNGVLSAEVRFWRKAIYKLNKTKVKPTHSKRITGLRVEV